MARITAEGEKAPRGLPVESAFDGAEGVGDHVAIQLAAPPAQTTLETLFILGASAAAGSNPYDAAAVQVPLRKSVGPEVGLYKLNPVDPQLESAWFLQPLNLSSEKLVSILCFQIRLVPLRRGYRNGREHLLGVRGTAPAVVAPPRKRLRLRFRRCRRRRRRPAAATGALPDRDDAERGGGGCTSSRIQL
jgi:hypothetical protein